MTYANSDNSISPTTSQKKSSPSQKYPLFFKYMPTSKIAKICQLRQDMKAEIVENDIGRFSVSFLRVVSLISELHVITWLSR